MAKDKEQWLKEFTEFSEIDGKATAIPPQVFAQLRSRLFPNPWIVFSKIFGLHLIVGSLSLTVCSQFGLNPFNTSSSLADWFMKVGGHSFCMVACGVLFMASTYLLANLFLTLEELEAVKRYEWLQLAIMGLVSLSAFYFFGAELVGVFAGLWAIGAVVGGYLSIEGSYLIRRSLA